MEKSYLLGDVYENILTKDKVIVLGMVPLAVKLIGESPNLHPDDIVNVTENKWKFVEHREIN